MAMSVPVPMLVVLTQNPNAISSSSSSPSSSSIVNLSSFSKPTPKLPLIIRLRFSSTTKPRKPTLTNLTTFAADGGVGPLSPSPPPPPPPSDTVFVGDDGVPLEGVIQFDKPNNATPSKLLSWAQVGLLAGGDVLCLLLFSAIGRFTHGFPVADFDTLRTADPFIAGWFFSAYFLGAYGDDAKGFNGTTQAITAAAKSWALGIPLGIIIRSATSGHIPSATFMLVTMGSTGILLNGWRALASNFLSSKQSKKNDVYKRGSPFELFELLTSLVRRW